MSVAPGCLVAVIAIQAVGIVLLVRAVLAQVSGQTAHVEKLQRAVLAKSVNEWERVERTSQRVEVASARAQSEVNEAQNRLTAEFNAQVAGLDGDPYEPARMPSDLAG